MKIRKGTIKIKSYLETIKIPILNNISLYKILEIYVQGIIKGSIGVRAAAASWNIFMSFLPFFIFFLLLTKYLPYYENIKQLIYDFLLKKMLPPNVFDLVNVYMKDRIDLVHSQLETPNPFLLISSVLLFIFLSSNGVRSLMYGFKSINNKEPLEFKGVKSIFMSIFIVLFFSIFILVSFLLVYITEGVFIYFENSFLFDFHEYRFIINKINLLLSTFIFFIGLCFLYYFGRTEKISFRGVMPGALLTTILFSITTYFFGYYISNFTRFNVFYGSLGSVLIVMIWLNISVTLIFIGYELNVALKKAKYYNEKK